MTSGTRNKVRHFRQAGMSVREIAQALGISTQAVYKHLQLLGLSPPPRPPRSTEQEAS